MAHQEFLVRKGFARLLVVSAVLLFTILSVPGVSSASWLYYHRPEYNGRVIDIETGGPIEEAVVVIIYYSEYYAVVDTNTSVIKVREVLTDKDGKFRIPSYTTLLQPFSWDAGTHPGEGVKSAFDFCDWA